MRLRPCTRLLVLRQTIGEHDEAAADDCRDGFVAGLRALRLSEEFARVAVEARKLLRRRGLMGTHSAIQAHGSLPRQQVAALVWSLLEQRRRVALGALEPGHVVRQESGEHVL